MLAAYRAAVKKRKEADRRAAREVPKWITEYDAMDEAERLEDVIRVLDFYFGTGMDAAACARPRGHTVTTWHRRGTHDALSHVSGHTNR